MKVINLNESQYRRLFEIADYSENDLSTVPTSVSPSEASTMIDGGVSNSEGEPELVDKNRAKKHLMGTTGYKQKNMSIEYPWTNRGIHY
jgi:hypothetical protein